MTFDPSQIVLARKPMPYDHRDFRMVDFITPAMRARAGQITAQEWNAPIILDQGATPHCVGYAWATFGNTFPVSDGWDNNMGENIYYAAKVIDGEPGAEDGSSTRSGVQAFMQYGHLDRDAYAFAGSMQDIITWVLANGPVVVGTNWYDNMFYPDADGLVTIGGNVAGGHEWTIIGVDTIARVFHAVNTWGTSWALKGHFVIGFDDMQRLLNEQGDACTAAEVTAEPVPPTPTPVPVPVPTPTPTPKVPKWFKELVCYLCKQFSNP